MNFYLIPFLASSRRGIGELVNLSVFTVNVFIIKLVTDVKGFPGGLDSQESTCNAGDLGSIPGLAGPVEEGMATHSSILAWRILWTEEPGWLQAMGSQRVRHRHDRVTKRNRSANWKLTGRERGSTLPFN